MAIKHKTPDARLQKMVIFKKMGWTTVGEILAIRRRELKLTLQKLAVSSNTFKGYICGIEVGILNPPSPDILTLICRKLGLDPESMILKSWVEKAPISVLPQAIELFKNYRQPVAIKA